MPCTHWSIVVWLHWRVKWEARPVIEPTDLSNAFLGHSAELHSSFSNLEGNTSSSSLWCYWPGFARNAILNFLWCRSCDIPQLLANLNQWFGEHADVYKPCEISFPSSPDGPL